MTNYDKMRNDMSTAYVRRAGWDARRARGSSLHVPGKITIHHTVTPNGESDMPVRMRQMQSYHMDIQGWSDIGYHFCIGQDGRVYEGRPPECIGAHVGGANTGNIGIAMIGTYDTVEPPGLMMQMLTMLLRAIKQYYSIDMETLRGHRDYHIHNTCPGQMMYDKIQELKKL